jgi:hypothetical protein
MINSESQVEQTIAFLSNHFELIVYSGLTFFFFFCIVYLVLLLGDSKTKAVIRSLVNEWVLIILLGLQFSALVSIYWINYKKPAPPLNVVKTILPDTEWVQSEVRIFYVDRNELDSVAVNGGGKQTVFASDDIIREFQFSPDGQLMILATHRDLHLIDLN